MRSTRFQPSVPGATASHRSERRWLTLLTLCLGVLIVQLDTSVVNLAVRPIGDYFDAGVGALQWVVDSYNLVYAVLLLTGGQLADLYGRRRIFVAGLVIFTAASVLCALAPAIPMLVAGRVFTGVGAAFLLPSSLAIIRVAWPDAKERGKALGIWTACNGLALAIGPTFGGLLVNTSVGAAYFSWSCLSASRLWPCRCRRSRNRPTRKIATSMPLPRRSGRWRSEGSLQPPSNRTPDP
jgi:MFS transporter, DHA2 family, methylenomycin A resistance protein